MSWLISEHLLRSSYKYKKHAEPRATPISNPLSDSDEICHRKGNLADRKNQYFKEHLRLEVFK